MRVFFALPLWNALDIGRFRADIGSTGLRWTAGHQLHLTLLFQGELAGDQLPLAVDRLRRAARCFPPFSLHWDRTGVFPSWKDPRVLWLGVAQPEARTVQELARLIGNPGLKPHLTVARVKGVVPSAALERWRSFEPPAEPAVVSTLCLVESQLTPQGPVYTVLEEAEFEGVKQSE